MSSHVNMHFLLPGRHNLGKGKGEREMWEEVAKNGRKKEIYAIKPSSTDLLLHVFCEVFKLCVMLKMDPFLNLTDEGLTETLTTGTSQTKHQARH